MNQLFAHSGPNLNLFRLAISRLTLYALFLFLGLGFHTVYVVFIAIFLLQNVQVLLKVRFKIGYLVLLALFLVFLLPQYSIGYNQITVSNPVLSMLSVCFSLLVVGYVFQLQTPETMRRLVVLMVLGIGLEAFISVAYSFYTAPLKYGYGLLYNPILGEETNSPGAANRLALLSSLLIFEFFRDDKLFKKIAILFVVVLVSVSAAWLASRAYFALMIIAFVLTMLLDFKVRVLAFFVFLMFFVVISLPIVFTYLDADAFGHIGRLSGGLESTRFSLYLDGLYKLLKYPIGGFEVNKNIENVAWFHNIFLDAARLAGWLPILGLVLFCCYSFLMFLGKKNSHYKFFGFIFFVVFILAQQDVVVEGMIRIVVVMFLCAISLSVREPYRYSS